jgi:hypothetical protein
MKKQRWTIDTTDDRFGDGEHHPYVVEGVVRVHEDEHAIHLFGEHGPLGAFPKANITNINREDVQ